LLRQFHTETFVNTHLGARADAGRIVMTREALEHDLLRVAREETAAEELLLGSPTARIVEAIQCSSTTPAQIEGAARLFAGWEFQQQRAVDLKMIPDALKELLWNHIKDTHNADKLGRAKRAFTRSKRFQRKRSSLRLWLNSAAR
jgi:hypothetical protein